MLHEGVKRGIKRGGGAGLLAGLEKAARRLAETRVAPGYILRHYVLPLCAGMLAGRTWASGVSFGVSATAAGVAAGANPVCLGAGAALGALLSGHPQNAFACLAVAMAIYLLKRMKALPKWAPSLIAGACALAAPLIAGPDTLYDTILIIVGALASIGACTVFSIALRANVSRRTLLSADEAVCVALSLVVLLMGASDIHILGFAPAVMLMVFTVMAVGYIQGAAAGAAVGVLTGAALYLPGGNGALMGALALAGLCAGAFRPLSRVGVALGFAVGGLLASVTMGASAPMPAMESGAAAVLLLLVPNGMMQGLRTRFESKQERKAASAPADGVRARSIERLSAFAEHYHGLAEAFEQALGASADAARTREQERMRECRALVGRQLEAVATAIDGLARDADTPIEYKERAARALAQDADRAGLNAGDICVRVIGGAQDVSVKCRACGGEGLCVSEWEPLVSQSLGRPMRLRSELCMQHNGRCALEFVEQEAFLAVTGSAVEAGSEEPCGDAHLFRMLEDGRMLLLICDGMGMGQGALTEAGIAAALVERMLVAGFEIPLILSTVNELLMARADEHFSTVDMCMLDLKKGEAQFIKIGAPCSWIRRGHVILRAASGALPLGIVQGVKPQVCTYALHDGDAIVMMSDGAADAQEDAPEEWMESVISTLDPRNPQEMAEGILAAARAQAKHPDDMTVLVTRIFKQNR